MNLANVRDELEYESKWRQKELLNLHNLLMHIPNEEEKRVYRKALITMLYAHFEGFCKSALRIYIRAINEEKLACFRVNECIAASSLVDLFQAIDDPNKNCDFFADASPHKNTKRFFRHHYLIMELNNLLNQEVNLSQEILDTDSNLKIHVLGKILYELGLSYNLFDSHIGTISNLVDRRNYYAHGENVGGVDEKSYSILFKSAYTIMNELKNILFESLRNREYLKT